MKVLQKLVCLFLIGINIIGWDAQAETVSMDHFADRCKIYIKCVRGHATREEYAAAKGTIAFDGVTAALIGTVLTVGTVVLVKCGPKSWQEWKNLGKWHNGSKRKRHKQKSDSRKKVEDADNNVIQKALDATKKIKSEKGALVEAPIMVGNDSVLVDDTNEKITLKIRENKGILDIKNYPLIQEYARCLVEQDEHQGHTISILIYNKDQTKHLSYKLRRNIFMIDRPKTTKATTEDEKSSREEQTQRESSGDHNSFKINDQKSKKTTKDKSSSL